MIAVAFITMAISQTAFSGRFDDIKDFPFMVQVKVKTDPYTIWCAGCYIRPRWVITAAHCLDVNDDNRYSFPPNVGNMQRVICIMGVKDTANYQNLSSNKLLMHPKYFRDQKRMANDIGLVRLKSAFRFSQAVNVIAIPSVPNDYGGERVTVINWTEMGTEMGQLMTRETMTHSTGACTAHTGSNTTICIGDKNKFVCAGDSGGPIIFKGMAIGVCSYGYGCRSDFAVYENTYAHVRWIESIAGPQTREKLTGFMSAMSATPQTATYLYFIFISIVVQSSNLTLD